MPILTVYARLTAMALRWTQSPVMIFSSRGETRTLTGLLPRDFKSPVSTIPPLGQKMSPFYRRRTQTQKRIIMNFTISSCGMQESNHASHKASRSYGRNVFTSFTNTAFVSSTGFNIEIYVRIVNPSRYLSILSVTSS